MVSQVRVVSILMIVHGSLLSLVALLYALFGPFMFAMVSLDKRPINNDAQTPLTIMMVIMITAGLLGLTCGILNIIAGIRSLKFRGRTLALVALFSNIPGLVVIHCWYFTVGIAIYGLIVFFDKDVIRAFEMGEKGVSPEDILEEFRFRRRPRRRRYEEDEDWEEDQPRRPAADSRDEPDDRDRFRYR